MPGRKRGTEPMRVIPRFVYNPEKCERGLKAMADILADAVRRENGIREEREEQLPS